MVPILRHGRVTVFHGNAADLQLAENSIDAIVTDPPAGIKFMSKRWDGDKGGRDAWIAWLVATLAPAFRALKPGGHALVWALPRTSHWTATALENCGFEIRDIVMHLFGTGFPKGRDISKDIDKRAGVVRQKGPIDPERAGRLVHQLGDYETEAGWSAGDRRITIDEPVTDDAKHWAGWDIALKPAAEHWILCRKPLIGTVVENVLTYGTGGLNIDACRIETHHEKPGAVGRWPAHLVLDEDAAAVLDAQSGTLHARGNKTQSTGGGNQGPTKYDGAKILTNHHARPELAVDGGASRFFYVAKAARSEKEAGLVGPSRERKDAVYGDGLNSASKVRTEEQETNGVERGEVRNAHPTVKSIALMRWLIRLITPLGGVVLDPFAGSGSTGVAAIAEGMRCVLVEAEIDYIPTIKDRIRHALLPIAPPRWDGQPV